MAAQGKFEIVKHEGYRFIGKSIYIGNKGSFGCFDSLRDYLWERSAGIFKALDELNEYATDEVHIASLVSWDRCDSKNELYGYTIGRFMRAGTPVPHDMDYIDIPAGYIAKSFIQSGDERWLNDNRPIRCAELNEEALKQHDEFDGLFLTAEVYPASDEIGCSLIGLYEFGIETKKGRRCAK